MGEFPAMSVNALAETRDDIVIVVMEPHDAQIGSVCLVLPTPPSDERALPHGGEVCLGVAHAALDSLGLAMR